MSQQGRRMPFLEKTGQVLYGSLKHGRAAVFAAVLVPLVAMAVSPVVAAPEGDEGVVPSPCDFATSGGFVRTDGNIEANFGAHGGCKHDGFWGHVNFVDHTSGYHVDSLEITAYVTPFQGSNVRDICGLARTNNPADGQPVAFRIRLVDNGEPGVADEFGIRLSNEYLVSTRLLNDGLGGGGNVQLHEPNRSTADSPSSWTCFGVDAP